MKYSKTEIYDLHVTGTLITNERHYFLAQDQELKFRVRMLPFQQTLPNPATIRCVVSGYDADASPIFVQYKADIARQLYSVNEGIHSFTVSKRLGAPDRYRCSYRGYDANGLQVSIQTSGGIQLALGRSVQCTVRHIDDDGHLTVVPTDKQQNDETNFLTYAQLMHNIQAPDPPASLQLEALRTRKEQDKKTEQMLTQYDSYTGLWIVTYLTVIRHHRQEAIARGDFDTAQALIRHKLRIIEWMLEDSLFLTYYSPELVGPLRQKCEHEAEYGETMLQAIDLTRKEQAGTYLQKTFTKINTTGYLYDRRRKIAILIALIQINPALLEKHAAAFTGFCHYMANNDTEQETIDAILELLRLATDEETLCTDNTRLMLRLLGLRMLLSRNRTDSNLSVCRSRLYRYASLLAPASLPTLINKALIVLTHIGHTISTEFSWDDLLQFNPDILTAKLCADPIPPDSAPTAQYNFHHSTLQLREGAFYLYAGCASGLLAEYQKQSELLSLFDGQLRVITLKEFKPKMAERQDLMALKKSWEGLYRLLRLPALPTSPTRGKIPVTKTIPQVGTSVIIRLQKFNPRFPLLMFADIDDPEYKGSGVLMASEISRYHVQSLDNVFYQDDIFVATVIRAEENGRLAFSIAEELFEMVQQRITIGKQVKAKLNKITSAVHIWVTKDGYSVYTPAPPASFRFNVDESALLRITSINSQGFINGIFLERTDVSFDPKEALTKLVSEYINYCSPEIEEADPDATNEDQELESTLKKETEPEFEDPLPLGVIRELGHLMNTALNTEQALLRRYQLLNVARLLAVLTDNEHQAEYYSLRMNYEENIYSFATCDPAMHWEDFLRIDAPMVERFPALRPCLERIRILRLYHDHSFDPTLAASLSQPMNPETSHLIRLVLGHSLMYHTLPPEALELIHDELLTRLGAGELVVARKVAQQEEKPIVYNLGRESGELEFKTSIVYPAGGTVPNMKYQSDVILRTMAGLLNAEGGTLYIGVTDSGDVNGLTADYTYMQCTSDGYERYIRQRIIALMGKEINGMIRIDFPTYGKHEVCRLVLPCHGKLVELEGSVWQRQGNSTLLLDGNALRKQQLRKQESLKTELKSLKDDLKVTEDKVKDQTPEPIQLVSNLLQTDNTAQTAVAAAFAASLERKSKKKEAKTPALEKKKNGIETSRIRPNPIQTKGQAKDTEFEVETYLSLLDNGGYILNDEPPRRTDNTVLLTLVIGRHETDGSLLLCYDNACVNRISLKTLLQKKRGYAYKNGTNKEARLLWASIENGEPYLLVRILKLSNTYLKMMSMKGIKINTDLSLKGTPFYSFDFGQVTGWEAIPAAEGQKLQRLVNENLNHLGPLSISEAITDAVQELKRIGFEV